MTYQTVVRVIDNSAFAGRVGFVVFVTNTDEFCVELDDSGLRIFRYRNQLAAMGARFVQGPAA